MIPTDPDRYLFLEALRMRKVAFTYAFIIINVVVFLLMQLSGGSTNEATLLAFGVKSNRAINEGEIWRFLTPVFIHIGLLHLLLNSYALWVVGQQVEKLYGGRRFVTLYILMGVSGVVGSYLFYPDALSAGASGAIFGLFGVLFVFGIRHSSSVPQYFGRAMWAGILPIIVINLIIGFAIPAIDNAAHIGGLLSGMLLAACFGFQAPGEKPRLLFKLTQVAALGVTLLAFVQVGLNYDGPPLRPSNLVRSLNPLDRSRGATDEFIRAVNSAQRSFGLTRRAVREEAVVRSAENLSGRLANSIDLLRDAPSLSATSDKLIQDLKGILESQFKLVEEIRKSGRVRAAHEQELDQTFRRYRTAFDNILEWVETDGARYGLRLRSREGAGSRFQPGA
jgi:rhomboid protease GluP